MSLEDDECTDVCRNICAMTVDTTQTEFEINQSRDQREDLQLSFERFHRNIEFTIKELWSF